jgi:PBSX family phage terminase large subunit
LTADEWELINAYFDENMNQTQAYLSIHKQTGYDVARTKSSQIFAKGNVRAEIRRRLREGAMSADEVLFRLREQAQATHKPWIRVDAGGFIYFDFSDSEAKRNLHLIKKIKTKRERRVEGRGELAQEWEGEWVEVELHDPQKALDMIGKYHNLFKEKEEPKLVDAPPLSIPAHMIAKDFLDVYRDILSGENIEYALDGGRGSTKSSFVALVSIMLMVNNPKWHMLALRQVSDTLRSSVFSQLQWAIDELGLSDKFKATTNPLEITYIPTGQKVYFRGASDPINLKSIKPSFGYIALLWFEEFDQFRGEATIRSIVQSALRGGDRAYRFETWNTSRSKNHWTNKYLATPKAQRYHLRTNYLNVPKSWLGQVFIHEAEYLRDVNDDAYKHEYLGEVTGIGGMVFENVIIRPIADEEIEQFDRIYEGLDWGYYPDPFNWGRMYYDAARMTLYIFDEYRAYKKGNEDTYKELKEQKKIGTNLIIADSAEPKSIADYRVYGANVRGAEKGPDSVSYSMKWLQRLKAIVIDDKRAPHHASEFLNYELEQDKDGEYISAYPDKNNHAIDDTRYALNTWWRRGGQ